MADLDYLLQDFADTFYLKPAMLLSAVIFILIAFRNRSTVLPYKLFTVYGCCSILQTLTSILFIPAIVIQEITVIGFIILEFITFYTFFIHTIPEKRNKLQATVLIYLTLTIIIFLLYLIFFTASIHIRKLSGYFSVFTSFFLLIPTLYYFYKLLSGPPVKKLIKEPTFWVNTGIIILHGVNIPLFLIENYLFKLDDIAWNSIYSFNYIAYCILFVCLSVAILRKPDTDICFKTKNLYSIKL